MSNGGFEQQGSVAGMPPELFSLFLRQLGIEPEFAGVGPNIGIPNPRTGQGTFTGQPSAGATAPAPTTGQGTLAKPKRNLSAIRALSLIAVPAMRAVAAGLTGPRRGRNRQFYASLLAGGAQQFQQEVARPRQEMLENLKVMADIARARAAQRVGQAAASRAKGAAAAPKFKPGTPIKARTKDGKEEIFIQKNTETGKFEEVPGFRPPLAKPSGTRQIKARREKDGSETLFIQKKPGSKEFEQIVIVQGEGAPAAAAGPAAPSAAAPGVTPSPAAGRARVPFVSAPKPTKRGTALKIDQSSGNWVLFDTQTGKVIKDTGVSGRAPKPVGTALKVDQNSGNYVLFNTDTGKVIKDTGILGREPKDDKERERAELETTALRILKIARKELMEAGKQDPSGDEISNKALDLLEERQRRRPESGGSAAKVRKAIRDITRRRIGKEGLLQLLGLSAEDFLNQQ
jgi:hypothetical protein